MAGKKMAGKRCSTVTFADALASGQIPKKSVLITFDDGYLDNWIYALSCPAGVWPASNDLPDHRLDGRW